MGLAQASPAGRIAILRMSSLSQHGIYGQGNCVPFSLELESLKARKKTHAPADMAGLYERIWKCSMPGLVSERGNKQCDSLYVARIVSGGPGELYRAGVDGVRKKSRLHNFAWGGS